MQQGVATEERLVIAGEPFTSRETVAVVAPWDGDVVGVVPTAGQAEARSAVEAAYTSMRKGLPAHERAVGHRDSGFPAR